MNETEKRVKILEVFHDTVRLPFSSFFCWLLEFPRVPCFDRRFNTDERTERLLHGSFGDQFGLNVLLSRPYVLLDS